MMNLDPQLPNLGQADPFALQHQQARNAEQQSIILSDEALKQYNALMGDTKNLSLMSQQAQAMGNYPQLKTDVQAVGISDGIMRGVANGIGNGMMLRQYGKQQQAYKDVAQAAQAQRQQQINNLMEQAQLEETRRKGGIQTLPENIRTQAQYLNPTALDDVLKSQVTGQQDINKIPLTKAAESKAAISTRQDDLNNKRDRFHALTGIYPEQVFAQGNQGALTPQVQSAWQYTYGTDAPKDLLDYQKRFADVGSATESYKGAVIDNQTRGESNQADLDGKLINNSIQQVNANYAEALKQADLLTAQGKIEAANTLKTNLAEGRKRYDQAISNYDKMSDGQIKLFNSQMKSLSLPYELPTKTKLQATTKEGKVGEFYDPTTGQVIKPVRPK